MFYSQFVIVIREVVVVFSGASVCCVKVVKPGGCCSFAILDLNLATLRKKFQKFKGQDITN